MPALSLGLSVNVGEESLPSTLLNSNTGQMGRKVHPVWKQMGSSPQHIY